MGHHLALISVQSHVAAHTLDIDGAVAREALVHVKSASRKEAVDRLGVRACQAHGWSSVSLPAFRG
jgi:hypothetical protein